MEIALAFKMTKKFRLVNFVLVGSKSGKYGGPYETSLAQVRLTNSRSPVLFFGFFRGDKPEMDAEASTFRVRHLFNFTNFFDVGSLLGLVQCWRMANTDVAHISFARGVTPYFYTWACILRKARVIVQTHGMLTSRASTPQRVLDSFFTKPLIKRAQAIVALTEFEQAALSTWCPEISNKITVVGNPSQASLLKKVQEPVPGTALFAARLHPRKRVIDFANASKFSFESQWEEKYFALGPDEGDLPRLQAISAKVPNLQYLGATDTIGALDQICRCAVFVLSSENEPWGNALVAALSIGRPVVITESSHLSGLVQIYQAGIVVPDRDPEAIARAVHDICASSNYAQFSKNASMLSLLHFSDNTIQRQLLELYGDC